LSDDGGQREAECVGDPVDGLKPEFQLRLVLEVFEAVNGRSIEASPLRQLV